LRVGGGAISSNSRCALSRTYAHNSSNTTQTALVPAAPEFPCEAQGFAEELALRPRQLERLFGLRVTQNLFDELNGMLAPASQLLGANSVCRRHSEGPPQALRLGLARFPAPVQGLMRLIRQKAFCGVCGREQRRQVDCFARDGETVARRRCHPERERQESCMLRSVR
jgi:hypothetical protein